MSLTAEPLFRSLGFRTERRQTKIHRNRAFKRLLMEKNLPPGEALQSNWVTNTAPSASGAR
jgi:hypothetical protein